MTRHPIARYYRNNSCHAIIVYPITDGPINYHVYFCEAGFSMTNQGLKQKQEFWIVFRQGLLHAYQQGIDAIPINVLLLGKYIC